MTLIVQLLLNGIIYKNYHFKSIWMVYWILIVIKRDCVRVIIDKTDKDDVDYEPKQH
jgi:hypothetical protein